MSLLLIQTQDLSSNPDALLETPEMSSDKNSSEKTSLLASEYFENLNDDLLGEWTLLPSETKAEKGLNDYIWIDIGNLEDCLWMSLSLSNIMQIQEHCALEFTWTEAYHQSRISKLCEEPTPSIPETSTTQASNTPLSRSNTPHPCTGATTLTEFVDAFNSEKKWMVIDLFPSTILESTRKSFKKTRSVSGFKDTKLPDQLFLDITRQATYINGSIIPNIGIDELQVAVLWEQLLQCTKTLDQAKAVAKLCTQATVFDMTQIIWKRYTNPELKIFPTQRSTRNKHKNPNLTFAISTTNGNIRIKVTMWYQLMKIASDAEILGYIKGTTLIDLDEDQAIVTWSDLLPKLPNTK